MQWIFPCISLFFGCVTSISFEAWFSETFLTLFYEVEGMNRGRREELLCVCFAAFLCNATDSTTHCSALTGQFSKPLEASVKVVPLPPKERALIKLREWWLDWREWRARSLRLTCEGLTRNDDVVSRLRHLLLIVQSGMCNEVWCDHGMITLFREFCGARLSWLFLQLMCSKPITVVLYTVLYNTLLLM